MVVESEKLQAALAKVRTSILLDYGELFGSEERCRQRVIDPILSALGWDIFSDEVVVEHPLPSLIRIKRTRRRKRNRRRSGKRKVKKRGSASAGLRALRSVTLGKAPPCSNRGKSYKGAAT
jgi:hypothetical protein